ncbi:MAG: hypothetical protein ACSW8J_10235 [bacterium]
MNRKSRVTFGPGAASLILIVVILSMSVLGILALMNARNDIKLSDRSVQVVQAAYALNESAERRLASLDAIASRYAAISATDDDYTAAMRAFLPTDMVMSERTISWEETDGVRTLECAVTLNPMGEGTRFKWVNHRLTATTTEDAWN